MEEEDEEEDVAANAGVGNAVVVELLGSGL